MQYVYEAKMETLIYQVMWYKQRQKVNKKKTGKDFAFWNTFYFRAENPLLQGKMPLIQKPLNYQ